jgi:hypothetical protein
VNQSLPSLVRDLGCQLSAFADTEDVADQFGFGRVRQAIEVQAALVVAVLGDAAEG